MMRRLPAVSLIALIRGYQIAVSPMLGARCRFAPSCSHYTAEAISIHGATKGLWLGAKRILKCHPWGASGFDPVPPPAPRIPAPHIPMSRSTRPS